jgi:hypothetical protein
VLVADTCRFTQDEAGIVAQESTILNELASFPNVFQSGTNASSSSTAATEPLRTGDPPSQVFCIGQNCWTFPATSGFPPSFVPDLVAALDTLKALAKDEASDASDLVAEKIAERILGGKVPCAVGVVNDLSNAIVKDDWGEDQYAHAIEILNEINDGTLHGASALDAESYAILGAKATISKLKAFATYIKAIADALTDSLNPCFATGGNLAAELAAEFDNASDSATADANNLAAALSGGVGLVPQGGWLVLGPQQIGGTVILPVVADPNESPLPLSQNPPNLPSTAIVVPPVPEPLSVGTTSVAAGGVTTIAGGGFQSSLSGGTIYIGSMPERLGTFTTDANGSFTANVLIPADLPAGTHELYAIGTDPSGNLKALAAPITVTGSASTGSHAGCVGTLSGTINGSLTVLAGMPCTLVDARVNGTITVEKGAVFEADSSTLNGGVAANSPETFALCGDQVNGIVAGADSSAFPPLIGTAASAPECGPTKITGGQTG